MRADRRDEGLQLLMTAEHQCDPERPCEPNDHLCKNYKPNVKDERAKHYERLVAQETLILAATEEVCRLMGPDQDSGKVTRKELAKRLGCGKSHVTQLLSGERNLTLRTLADLAGALGHQVTVKFEPLPGGPGEKNAARQGAEIRHVRGGRRGARRGARPDGADQ
jgi:hypothetical protein